MSNNNNLAFPYHTSTLTQLTKREWFAGMALQGLLANPAYYQAAQLSSFDLNKLYANEALQHADDILELLEEKK